MDKQLASIEQTESKTKRQGFDMSQGSVWSVFKKIWIPAIVSAIIAGTFTVFDTLFVSIGYHAQAMGTEMMVWAPTEVSQLGVSAMSYAQPYTFLIIGFGVMIGGGIAQRIAKAQARGDNEEAQKILNSYIPSIIKIGLWLSLFLFVFAKPLIWLGSGFQPYFLENWFNNPEMVAIAGGTAGDAMQLALGQQLSQATWYLRVQALGAIPYMIMVSGALILRVTGKPGKATIYAFYALLTNMIFDALFVCILGLNLFGAALATIMAQMVAAYCYMRYFRKKADLKITTFDWAESKRTKKENRKAGSTSFILQAVNTVVLISTTMGIGFVFYNQAEVIALYQSSFQGYYALFCFANMVLVGTAFTLQPIVAFNHARGDHERVRKTKSLAIWISMSIGVVYASIMIFMPQIIAVFVSIPEAADPNAILYAQRILQMMFLAYIPYAFSTISGNYLQAKGKNYLANWIVYLKPLILLPLILLCGFGFYYLLPDQSGTWNGMLESTTLVQINGIYPTLGIFWAFLIAEIPAFILSIFGLREDSKETRRLEKNIK